MKSLRRLAGALALASLCLVATGSVGAPPAKTHTVVIDGLKYIPENLTVKRGESVTWVNKDPFPHTVTAKGAFDSKDIAEGKSWRYIARKPGRYDYICTLHPNMKATLIVE